MIITKDEIVRLEIIAKAQQLFQQFGLKKTTMDDIAAACGKGKSTLYYYFKSKEEVFDAVIKKELVTLRTIVKQKVDEQKTIQDKLAVYFRVFHLEVLNKVNLYRIVKLEIFKDASMEFHFDEVMDFEKNYLIRLFEDGADAGQFHKVEKKDIPWFSEILIAAFLGIVRYSIESDNGFNQEKLEKATDLLLPSLFA
ncbi:MAG: TetR/AcrR family transcriptional regulator [Bacteroidales bacterium]|jgi:AcrR family transcriptional regulator